ncbi:2-polyprenyl-6-methoxyphenol hydroxylase-like FAD-dependent oxidoreductase [Mycetocola sp. CAN_C7]|uniref:FAD-dependent monooxygenase n=1 Tax=Mycetocola sp. CAN_C7 TaxID=2787724 RepID=UPI0018CB17C0
MSTFSPVRTADVLVVGAGPTGLLLAVILTRLGVDVILVDAKSGPTRESRALAVQARSMEILDQFGLAAAFLDQTMIATRISPGYENSSFGSLPIGLIGVGVTPFAGIHVLEQSRTERLLADHLDAIGGSITWNSALSSLTDSGDGGIEATVDGPDGRVTVTARYCVGADGASSVVRKLRGIPFGGVTNEHTFYVADAHGVTGLEPGAINVRFGADDFLVTFPMSPGGHDRLLGTVRISRTGEPVTESDARAKLDTVFSVDYSSTSWFSTYRISHRVALRFRDGPVFLAGDAGHVHSPVGAQGMNTGLQDAHNLGITLAGVLRRGVDAAALDRYESERRPVALRLVATTDRVFGLVTGSSWLSRFVRRRVTRVVAPVAIRVVPRVPGAGRLFEYISQTRIHYWMSDEAKATGKRGRVVGRRLPWTGTNHDALRAVTWQVHVYGPADRRAAVRALSGLGLPLHAFPSTGTSRLVPGRFYLVRPDGFVAAESPGETALVIFGRALDAAGEPRHGARVAATLGG